MNAPTLHRGKLAKHPRILSVRPLTREDLLRLRQGEGRVVPKVKQFRDTHHRLARLCAAGLRNEEIMRITGFSYTRLNTHRQDPAFQELVAQYRKQVTQSWVDEVQEVHDTAGALIIRGLRQVEEHFDQADEDGSLIPLKTLQVVTGDLMDRFGFSKKTVNTNVKIDYAKEMERMMAARGQSTVIDAEVASPSASRDQDRLQPLDPDPTPPAAVSAGFRRRV